MDKRRKILFITLLISFLLHIGLFWLIYFRDWLNIDGNVLAESIPEEVVITFPENRPEQEQQKEWEIVQNQNENEERPKNSNLLSDRNSQARNPVNDTPRSSETPQSSGNVPSPNLSSQPSFKSLSNLQNKRFSSDALTGESFEKPREKTSSEQTEGETTIESQGSNQTLNQKKFSVEELGALSLSTYQWNWAPYVNALKSKLSHVWFPPPAFFMGLIHGYTYVQFTINREGRVTDLRVLKHEGHESLEISSRNAIESLFPFLPLPEDFPDESLTIVAKLHYLDRSGR